VAKTTEKRDAKKTYSHGGKLYGPDKGEGYTVADLDKKSPRAAGAVVEDTKPPSK